jgi:hypothetical protein
MSFSELPGRSLSILRMSALAVKFSALVLLLMLGSGPVMAQTATSAAVIGTVKDASGAVVVGGEVDLVNTETGATRVQQTTDQGQYTISDVAPGTYAITVKKQGFETAAVASQQFNANQSYTVNVSLQVGASVQTVQVNANDAAIQLQTTDSQIGNTLESQQFVDLPTLTRDAIELLYLQPGAAPNANTVTDTFSSTGGGVAGALPEESFQTLDGIDVTNNQTGGPANKYLLDLPVPVETVSEFRVSVSTPNATFGRASGGQVSIISNSGTNTFHGAAYGFVQNTDFNANTWDNKHSGIARSTDRDNRDGFTFGGPLQKDKTFFFGNYEVRRFFQSVPDTIVIPSDALRQGLITINGTQYNVKNFDPRGIGLSPTVAALWSKYPATGAPGSFLPGIVATSGDGINTVGYHTNLPAPRADFDTSFKLDHNFGSNLHWFGRYQYFKTNDASGVGNVLQYDLIGAQNGSSGLLSTIKQFGDGITSGFDQVIRPNLVNSIRFGRVAGRKDYDIVNPAKVATLENLPETGGPDGPVALYTGSVGLPIPIDGQATKNISVYVTNYEAKDDLNWSKGSHTLSFGGDLEWIPTYYRAPDQLGTVRVWPTANIAGDLISSYPTSDFPAGLTGTNLTRWEGLYPTLLGIAENTNIMGVRTGNLQPTPLGTEFQVQMRERTYYFYAQDIWRIKPTLTLNYGLGYGWQTPVNDVSGGKINGYIDYDNGQPIDPAAFIRTRQADSLQGQVYDPTLAFESYKGQGRTGEWNIDRGDFGPRASLAWNPSANNGFLGKLLGNRKTVVRGGYAIAYDRFLSTMAVSEQTTDGYEQFLTVNLPNCAASSTPGTACNTASTNPASSLFRVGVDGTLPVVTNLPPATDPVLINGDVSSGKVANAFNLKPGRVHMFDLSVQRELSSKQILEVGYVGRIGHRLQAGYDLMQVPYDFKDPTSGQTFAQAFDAIAAQLRAGTSGKSVTTQPWFEDEVPGIAGSAKCAGTTTSTQCLASSVGIDFTNDNVGTLVGSGAAVINNYRVAAGLPALTYSPAVSSVSQVVHTGAAWSNYNALVVSYRNTGWRGLTYTATYTWSHSLDVGEGGQTGASTFVNSIKPGVNYGSSAFDRTHVGNVFFSYDLPFAEGHDLNSYVSRGVRGWYVSGVFTASSGLPISVTNGSSSPWGDGSVTYIPTVPLSSLGTGAHVSSNGSVNYFANPTTAVNDFRAIAISTDQRDGRGNSLRGFPMWNFDARLAKKTQITEHTNLEFSADFFNLFNHVVFNNPSLSLSTPSTFGAVNSQFTPGNRINGARWVQFGLELRF